MKFIERFTCAWDDGRFEGLGRLGTFCAGEAAAEAGGDDEGELDDDDDDGAEDCGKDAEEGDGGPLSSSTGKLYPTSGGGNRRPLPILGDLSESDFWSGAGAEMTTVSSSSKSS